MGGFAEYLRADRLNIPSDVTEEEKRRRIEGHWRVDRQRRASESYDRLHPSGVLGDVTRTVAINEFIRICETDAASLPAERLFIAYAEGLEPDAMCRTPGSKRWRNFGPDFFDFVRTLIGAAFCTVFTCDCRTARTVS